MAENIKNILQKFNAKPKKYLGQNFLIDKNILNKIIESSDISPKDTVLEVGPGTGILTRELAKKAGKIIAVEKDKSMCKILENELKDFKNTEIINADILKINLSLPPSYKVIANIPYYLTSAVIRKFLELENQPTELILMIQKEVAKRICETPPKMSLLAVSVQFYATPKIIFNVSKNSFWPVPKVDSVVIKITPHKTKQNPEFIKKFFKIVKAGFSQPRKQLVGNLSKTLKIEKGEINSLLLENNINPTQRAETLSVANWISLINSIQDYIK
jgi:16S rRNA (adenine1518-N6/adenine1519-N6)-dimethyltransferase